MTRTNRGVWMLGLLMMTFAFTSSDTGITPASTRYRRNMTQVAPGIKLIRILDRRGPNRIKVLSIDPESRTTIDSVLSNNLLPGFERTSSMARRRGAIAAINGDYGVPWGRPPHVFAEDGLLKGTPIPWGRAFAISQDERSTYFGHPSVRVSVLNTRSRARWRVQLWNERDPDASEIAAYTPAAGGHLMPPRSACSARLQGVSRMRWGSPSRLGVMRDYRVDAEKCSSQNRMKLKGGIVLAARRGSARAPDLKRLRRGDIATVKWTVGWRGVLDVIGGNPTLLEKRRNTVGECPPSASFCRRHPRTGVGVKPNGHLLFVVVDGRRPGNSVGMRPMQFARLFRYLGATSALNLDGGGSTTMVVRDRIVNQPSDSGGERAVSSALVVLPGDDPAEKEPAPYPRPSSPSRSIDPATSISVFEMSPNAAGSAAASKLTTLDPASTGGLLDALSKGAFGNRPVDLHRGLRRIAARFRDGTEDRAIPQRDEEALDEQWWP